jgi:pimeloyl-ACP methyl ester carboxylesterase
VLYATELMAEASGAISGRAAGVPFVALPPPGGATGHPPEQAPVVVAWHLGDPPRTEAAFAAAVPLAGLEAWRVYLGLPLHGSRTPSGGPQELMRRGFEDGVLQVWRPVAYGAAEEFGPAFAELRGRLGLGSTAAGVMGGSFGSAVAQLVMAESDLDVRAAVLISPVVQLRRAVEAITRRFDFHYEWSEEANRVAARLDFVARAPELLRRRPQPAVLLVVGERDAPEFRESAAELQAALDRGAPGRADLAIVPGMEHTLAEEPGVDPAPQTSQAAVVDRLAVDWFRRHLLGAA